MQVFTSAVANYIPKARVLARSLKRYHPDAMFHLVLSDEVPAELREKSEPFDSIVHVEELPIENLKTWIFKHTLVELCTAVKGEACRLLMERYPGEPLFYFDPDIAIFSPLTGLLESVRRHDILVTPHLLDPEQNRESIVDNEICSLKHGIYNLGFLGLASTSEARRFVDWWRDRLRLFCRADIPGGLFTDQRWVDLAPAFFPGVGILRDPGYNVATWNLTHRQVTGCAGNGFCVNGRPLGFYHFSGFDSGAQKTMLDKYGRQNRALYELRDWYIAQCAEMGQDTLGTLPWSYGQFSNGQPVTEHHRALYRERLDLQRAFPDPYAADHVNRSYCHWYRAEYGSGSQADPLQTVQELRAARQELELIRNSRSYRAARRIGALIRGRWGLQP